MNLSCLINKFALVLLVIQPITWIFGAFIFPDYWSLIPVALGCAQIYFCTTQESSLPRYIFFTHGILVLLYLILNPVCQLWQLQAGEQGNDFAVFSQLLHSLRTYGTFDVSMLQNGWVSFLTHHFSPGYAFALPLVWIGFEPSIALIVLNCMAIIGITIFIVKIFINLNVDRSWIPSLLLCILLHPTLRVSWFWGIRDETFALCFITLGIFYLCHERLLAAFFACLPALLFKETVGLVIFCLFLGAFLDWRKLPVKNNSMLWRTALILTIPPLIFSILYIFFPHLLFTPTFHATERIASISSLIGPTFGVKILSFLQILLPFFVFWLHNIRGIFLGFSSMPLLASIFISDFPEMWKPFNYYFASVIFLLGLSVIIGFLRSDNSRKKLSIGVILISLSLSLSMGTMSSPKKHFKSYLKKADAVMEASSLILSTDKVLADDWNLPLVYSTKMPTRLFGLGSSQLTFDKIIVSTTNRPSLPKYLLNYMSVCLSNDVSTVYCQSDDKLSQVN
jgi:hypothetical protein